MTKTYQVEGMTCEHCAASVREEVGEIAGVTKVDVDVASGQVAVSGSVVGSVFSKLCFVQNRGPQPRNHA